MVRWLPGYSALRADTAAPEKSLTVPRPSPPQQPAAVSHFASRFPEVLPPAASAATHARSSAGYPSDERVRAQREIPVYGCWDSPAVLCTGKPVHSKLTLDPSRRVQTIAEHPTTPVKATFTSSRSFVVDSLRRCRAATVAGDAMMTALRCCHIPPGKCTRAHVDTPHPAPTLTMW